MGTKEMEGRRKDDRKKEKQKKGKKDDSEEKITLQFVLVGVQSSE